MFAKQIKSLTAVLGLSLVFLSAGCFFGPGDGATVNTRTSSVFFEGATTYAGQTITIWAKKNDGDWQYVGKAVTVPKGLGNFGQSWHYWSVSKVVPMSCWKPVAGGFEAEIKAMGWDPLMELPVFNEGLLHYIDEYDDLGELIEAEGSGSTMTIYANS